MAFVGLILAGGEAKRFGGGKCEAPLKGRSLINWVFETLNPLVEEIWLSTRKGFSFPLPFARIIEDKIPFQGPVRALRNILAPLDPGHFLLVAPCDQPLLQGPLLSFLIQKARESSAEVIICQSLKGKPLPFPGLYRGGIKLEGRSFQEAFSGLKTILISPSKWQHYDPKGLSFLNINYKEDLKRIERLFQL